MMTWGTLGRREEVRESWDDLRNDRRVRDDLGQCGEDTGRTGKAGNDLGHE